MDLQLLARRLGLVLLITVLLASPAAANVQPSSSSPPPRHGGDLRLRVALDDAARSVSRALAALTAVATPPTIVDPLSAGGRSPSFSSSTLAAAAREDCVELLGDSLELLAGAASHGATRDDALAWLSAALTNHDTCADGLAEAGLIAFSGSDDDYDLAAVPGLAAARSMVRDALAALFYEASSTTASSPDAKGCVCKNETQDRDACGIPRWLPSTDRRLLLLGTADSLRAAADLVVAKDGTGTHATISDAVAAAPECSARRTVIHVKAGTYDEVVRVGTKKTNLVVVGDGAGRTVVTGSRSAADHITTFQTATFAASGSGFMMVDMTVENRAGPAGHQAVALRVSADRAVVHRCQILGHQDTLYAHRHRQFYRDCDVHGTVDFVFGNAAAVLQQCRLFSRATTSSSSSSSQQVVNTVTAQGRCEPCQATGFVLHDCQVLPAAAQPDRLVSAPSPAPALSSSSAAPVTYLGRPWRPYSRVVVMRSYIGAHVPPRGWMPWNASAFALDTLYYAEYANHGPGAGVAGRVTWRGHRVIADAAEAERFTVARFIDGAAWLPGTGVHFDAGLSL